MSESRDGTAEESSGLPAAPVPRFLPDAYRLPDGAERPAVADARPRVVFIEVTNRCNLRCQTCVRTFASSESLKLEPLKMLSFAEFVHIAWQFPDMRRCTLHGIGEPLLNPELPRMITYGVSRGAEVLFNSNGTLLSARWQEALVRSGLAEYRCSIDAARPATYAAIRGAPLLARVVEGLAGLIETRNRLGSVTPRVSIWCVATRETLAELPDLIRLAAALGVPEVYVQRMVFFADAPAAQFGMARRELALLDPVEAHQEDILAECARLSAGLDVVFRASGGRSPTDGEGALRPAETAPWRACLRPWTTAYITVNGNCLPCCIAPFATPDYESLLLGNVFARPFDEIWNDRPYVTLRERLLSHDQPHPACASCGVHWSL